MNRKDGKVKKNISTALGLTILIIVTLLLVLSIYLITKKDKEENPSKPSERPNEEIPKVELKSYEDGEIVYYDVLNGKFCSINDYHVDNSLTGYNGIDKTTGTNTQTSCLKFYAFLQDDNKVNLLLDHNVKDGYFKWDTKNYNSEELINEKQPDLIRLGLLEELKKSTKDWNGTLELANYTITPPYSVDITTELTLSYEVDYTDYNARFITAQEIADIIGASNKETGFGFDEKSANIANLFLYEEMMYFCFMGNGNNVANWQNYEACNSTQISKYGWLYDRTSWDCLRYGCPNNATELGSELANYWTISPVHITEPSVYSFWRVTYEGRLEGTRMGDGYASSFGIRPVIEVSRQKI